MCIRDRVKYHPNANNDIVGIIESEGGEAVVLDMLDFFLYGMYSKQFNFEHLSGSYKSMMTNKTGIRVVEWFRKPMRKEMCIRDRSLTMRYFFLWGFSWQNRLCRPIQTMLLFLKADWFI